MKELKRIIEERKVFIERSYLSKQKNVALIFYEIIGACEARHFSQFSVKWFAAQLETGPSFIVKSVKEVYDCTPNQMITAKKMKVAKVLLIKHPDLSIEEIAEMMSYHSKEYFIQKFKKECKITPHQYRLKKRAENYKVYTLKRLASKLERAINEHIEEKSGGAIKNAVYVHGGLQEPGSKVRSEFFF